MATILGHFGVVAVFIYLAKTQRNTKINPGEMKNPDTHLMIYVAIFK